MGGKDGFGGPAGENDIGGPDGAKEDPYEDLDDITRIEASGGITISGTYETVGD